MQACSEWGQGNPDGFQRQAVQHSAAVKQQLHAVTIPSKHSRVTCVRVSIVVRIMSGWSLIPKCWNRSVRLVMIVAHS